MVGTEKDWRPDREEKEEVDEEEADEEEAVEVVTEVTGGLWFTTETTGV